MRNWKDRILRRPVALVDSGADHILVSPWIAQDIGVTPDPNRSIRSRIGGDTRLVRFADVRVILAPPDIEINAGGFDRERSFEWDAQVGFSQRGPRPLGHRARANRVLLQVHRDHEPREAPAFGRLTPRHRPSVAQYSVRAFWVRDCPGTAPRCRSQRPCRGALCGR
jgi:hypothetical protein